jgi:hypothetical protein
MNEILLDNEQIYEHQERNEAKIIELNLSMKIIISSLKYM